MPIPWCSVTHVTIPRPLGFRLMNHPQLAGNKICVFTHCVCKYATCTWRCFCHIFFFNWTQSDLLLARFRGQIKALRCLKSHILKKNNNHEVCFGPFVLPRKKGTCTPHHPSPPLNCGDGVRCGINIKHRNTVKSTLYTYHSRIHILTKQNTHIHSAW